MAQTEARRGRSSSNVSGQHSFAQIPSVSTPRSKFNRSCGVKTTFSEGDLVPIFCDEALPGDTMSMRMTSFARMATPLHPIMDNMNLDVFFFAVPIRLIWDNFQKFMGEQTDPGDSTDYLVPQIVTNGFGWPVETLGDYMGLPIEVPNQSHSALWFRAYNLIWNEWFRDQNLQDSATVHRDDGPDLFTSYVMRKRGKRHDYFSSSLPWPQKGPAVELPLGTAAPVVAQSGIKPAWAVLEGPTAIAEHLNQRVGVLPAEWDNVGLAGVNQMFWHTTALEADLTSATSATINQLREAFQIQKLYERDARGGTRYTEILRAHFGVVSPDARLQRPEYLGGGSSRITINPVAQTSETASTPQGNLSAFVTSSNSFPSWTKSFTEHCVLIGLVSVRADLNYQQNVPRMFSRETRFDFYWPAFAHLGEQAVLSKEIFSDGSAADEDVWGYQERFAEYRYKPSQITGKMRSAAAGSLDTWHLAQDFQTRPLLNDAFIQENPPVERVIAVPSEPHFLFDGFFEYTSVRPMPTYSVPGQIDHF